jgi:hypothetical protein
MRKRINKKRLSPTVVYILEMFWNFVCSCVLPMQIRVVKVDSQGVLVRYRQNRLPLKVLLCSQELQLAHYYPFGMMQLFYGLLALVSMAYN